jgi:hypothetical protein
MKRRACCLVLSLLILSIPAFAQEREDLNTGVDSANAGTNRVAFAASAAGSQQLDTGIQKGGDFKLFRGRIDGDLAVRLSDTIVWDNMVKYQFDSYSFGGQTVDPWGTINTLQPTTILKMRLSDKLGVYGGATFRFAFEDSAHMGQAFTAGGLLGCNFAVSSNLTLGAGVAYVTRLEEDNQVLPIITVNWQLADNMLLTVGFLDVATMGYGAEFSYMVAPKWLASAGLQYHSARFRLLSNNKAAPDGVGQESSATLYGRGTFQATRFVSASAFAGIVAGGRLQVYTNNGHELYSRTYDTTGVVGGEVNVRF